MVSRAARSLPRCRRRNPCPCLPSRLSSSAQPDQEDTETSFALFSPLPCKLPALSAPAARSFPPAKHWLPWAATSKRSSPLSTPLRASPTPARAYRPPIIPQFRPELRTDERRPPPPRPYRGTLVSGHPRPRLSPSRASPPRLEVIRPLSCSLQPPKYLPAILPHRRPYCLHRAIATAHPDPISSHSQVHKGSLVPLLSLPLAAGDRRHRITPVNSHASLSDRD
jgi:hypothetical protein